MNGLRVAALWTSATPETRGIVMMVLSTIAFSAMHAIVRHISAELHPIQIAFFRNAFGMLVLLPWLMHSGFALFRTKRLGLHSVRAVMNVIAMFAFFTGLSLIPLAEATALSFTAPIFAAVLGVMILGERFHLRRWSAIVLGFAGTLIILRPGFQSVDYGAVLVLIAAGIWAATMIVIKVLGRTESSVTITAYMSLLLTVFSIGPALFVWRWPTPEQWGWMVVMGIIGTLAQMALAQSLKETEASVVIPFDFLKLIWAAALGMMLFAEEPGLYVLLGGAIIFASSTYIAYRENAVRRQAERESRAATPRQFQPGDITGR